VVEPKEITVRVITYSAEPVLIVEHDGSEKFSYSFSDAIEGGDLMKSAELMLTSLGWVPDIDQMYMDMSLMVLKFRRGLQ
jgi:hypothetical protein